jgi:hypothetical protein
MNKKGYERPGDEDTPANDKLDGKKEEAKVPLYRVDSMLSDIS